MAGDADRDAVLAFLLGSTPSLDAGASSTAESVEAIEAVDDPPALEPVTDSDVEPETDVSAASATAEGAASSNNSDWDAITSGESEDETPSERQVTAPIAAETQQTEEQEEAPPAEQSATVSCKEDPGAESCMGVKANHVAEAEHEDDCVAPTDADSDDYAQQEEKVLPKKETKRNALRGQSPRVVAKPAKTPKASLELTGNEAGTAVAPVATSKGLSTLKRDGSEPTMGEFLFVGCVVTVLVAYLAACVYSFFHPMVLPLPDFEELYSAYDISNVSVHIVNPVENAQITPQGISFEWQLANFPTEALHLYGAEVFRYQVSLDDEVITSEVGFLALTGEDSGAEALNRTVRFPIPLRKFTRDDNREGSDLFKLHLKVTIPIPGLIEELQTYEQDVYVHKPAAPSAEDGVHLTLTSPLDGATFEQNHAIVLEYTAVNVRNMEVLLDDNVYLRKTHVNDGNMLLRGMGVGPHTFEVRAVGERDEVVASSAVHIEIIESVETKAA